MTAMVLTNKISQSSSKTISYRTTRTQFGDGYEQRVSSGINDKLEQWRLNFENLTTTDRGTLETFLDDVKQSGVIEWTAFGDSVQKQWVLTDDPITETFKAGELSTVSFTIKRVFDL